MRPQADPAALALRAAAGRYRQPAEELLRLGGDADVAGITVGGGDGAVYEAKPFPVELGALLLAGGRGGVNKGVGARCPPGGGEKKRGGRGGGGAGAGAAERQVLGGGDYSS